MDLDELVGEFWPEVVTVTRTISQYCIDCGNTVATQVIQNKNGYHIGDTSTCANCGRVLWKWSRDETA